jgi:hypothetical protein
MMDIMIYKKTDKGKFKPKHIKYKYCRLTLIKMGNGRQAHNVDK